MKKSLYLTGLVLAFSVHAELPITVQLTPTPEPTVLSSSGGTVRYDRSVGNLSNQPLSLRYRGLLLRPDGSEMPMTSDSGLNLAAFGTNQRTGLGFSIPSYFPAGNYQYQLFYREPGKVDFNHYGFAFSKSGNNPAPNPRLALQLIGSPTDIPQSGGSFSIAARLSNISNFKETVRSWSVLTLPNGDKRIINEIFQQSLSANTSVNLASVVVTVSADDPVGEYRLVYYALSNGRNTPAITQQLNWRKGGTPISQLQWPDPELMRCLNQSAQQHGWVYVEEVQALHCRDYGIRNIDGLLELPALQVLDLADNALITAATTQLPITLMKLNLAGNRLLDFAAVSPMPELRDIDLSNNRITRLFGLESLKDLEALNLAGNDLDHPDDLQMVVSAMPQLKRLNLAGIYLGHGDVVHWLSNLWQLQELDLNRTGLTDFRLPHLPELHTIRVASNPRIDLAAIASLPNLRALDVSDTNQLDLGPLLSLTQLEELRLSGNTGLEAYHVHSLLQNNRHLKRLALADIVLSFDVVETLVQTGSNVSLEELDLANTDQAPYHLPFPQLRVLNLSDNPLTVVPALPHPEKLEALHLANTPIREAFSLLPAENLKVLNLSGCSAMPMEHLVPMVAGSATLRELYLANLPMQLRLADYPQMGQSLAELHTLDISQSSADLNGLVLPKLRRLTLAHANVSDPFPLIATAHQLRELDISGVHVPFGNPPVRDLDVLLMNDTRTYGSFDVHTLLYQNRELRKLGLRNISLRHLDVRAQLNALAPHLQSLDLSYTGLDEYQVQDIIRLPKLRELNLAGTRMQYFAPSLPRLQAITLRDMGLHHLHLPMGGWNPQFQLQHLDLSGNPELMDYQIQSLLSEHQGLKSLVLDGVDLSNVPLDSLLLARDRLYRLSLNHTGIHWHGPNMPALRELSLAGNTIANPSFPPFLEALNLSEPSAPLSYWLPIPPRVRELRLAASGISPYIIVTHVQQQPLLRELDIRAVDMHVMTMGDLLYTPFPGLLLLQSLDVSATGMTGMGDLSRLTGLRKVGLAELQLSRLPTLPMFVRELNVADNALNYLPSVELSELVALNISNNPALETMPLYDVFMQARNLQRVSVHQMPQLDFAYLFQPFGSHYLGQLRSLDVGDNALANLSAFSFFQLNELIADSNTLMELDEVKWGMPDLKLLDIRNNSSLPCAAVDELSWVRPELSIRRPEHCPAF